MIEYSFENSAMWMENIHKDNRTGTVNHSETTGKICSCSYLWHHVVLKQRINWWLSERTTPVKNDT